MPASRPPNRPHLPEGFGGLWFEVLDGSEAGVAVLDTELRYVYVNPALARYNGVPAAEHVGRTIAELLPELDAREDVLRSVLADGVPRETTSSGQTRAPSGHEVRHWHGTYHRLRDRGRTVGLAAVLMEVSTEHREHRELERARERLMLLDAAALRIGTTLQLEPTCQELADLLVETIADVATVEICAPARGGRRPGPGVVRMRRTALAALPRLRAAVGSFGEPGEYVDYQPASAIRRCLSTGLPVVENLVDDERLGRAGPNPERVAAYRAAGIHSALVVPLAARGAVIGTVTMTRAGPSPGFGDEDVAIAQALAVRGAVCLDNARRYTREHGIAVELQRSLLSDSGDPHEDIEVANRYLPTGETDLVGGDWFDTMRLSGGRTLMVMGDVMGHGMEAAVEMSHYKTMLRVVARMDLAPHRMLERMDELLADARAQRPATCVLALADPVRAECTYANAGHLPPAVVTPGGGVVFMPVPPGPPLGVDVGGRYASVTLPYLPGGVLLLYTDGLVERRGEDIDVSLERLGDLRLPVNGPLESLVDTILAAMATEAAEDDVAILAARRSRLFKRRIGPRSRPRSS